MKHVLEHADYMPPTRQHEPCHTDRTAQATSNSPPERSMSSTGNDLSDLWLPSCLPMWPCVRRASTPLSDTPRAPAGRAAASGRCRSGHPSCSIVIPISSFRGVLHHKPAVPVYLVPYTRGNDRGTPAAYETTGTTQTNGWFGVIASGLCRVSYIRLMIVISHSSKYPL